jgi:lysophospholipase L1-like esterase
VKHNKYDSGLLTICLLFTLAIVIAAGIFVSKDGRNPIEALMFFLRDGYSEQVDAGGETPDSGNDTEPEFIVPDFPFPVVTPGADTVSPETTISPETTPSDTPNGSETTVKPPETTENPTTPSDTTKRPETTARPKPETTPKPPETTKAPETTPKPPETTKAPETTVKPPENDGDYFSDALFLGDSRTVGFYLYARIPGATYFARTSMSVFNVFAEKKSETSDTSSYKDLTQLLTQKKFGKIYILLGINEIGYAYSSIVSSYSKTIEYIRMMQPDAKIIIQSNMHVTKKKSDANPNSFSNTRIDELNRRLAALADGKKVFYLGFEQIFDDASGAMSPDYSGDGVHLYAKCYKLWRDWMLENGKIY